MKRLLAVFLAALLVPFSVCAAQKAKTDYNNKIDPESYLCAELISEPVIMKGEPPIFQALQLDGYAAAGVNMPEASPDRVLLMVSEAYAWCQNRPEQKVMSFWRTMRKASVRPENVWNADTATCADYVKDPDDASGFIIWLDGYNRANRNTTKSILGSDDDVNAFIAACKANPDRKMIEVLREHAK